MSDSDLGLRRYKAKELTVGEAISLGYRAQTVCLVCERGPMLDLRRLAAQGRDGQTVESLKLKCTDCARHRRKFSIHPPGADTLLRVLFADQKARNSNLFGRAKDCRLPSCTRL